VNMTKRDRWKTMKIPKQCKSAKIPTPKISPLSIPKNSTIKDIVSLYTKTGSFQAGRLATACSIYKTMISEDATIGLTLAGAMTPAGIGGLIAQMISNGMIDWIIATGANVFHDLHYALNLPLHQGHFRVNDAELKKKKIDRIYDIFLTEEIMLRTDVYFIDSIWPHRGEKMTTAKLHNIIGKNLLEDGVDPTKSMVAMAAKYDVPIYTSSPGDSEIGLNMAFARLAGFELLLDPIQDVVETAAIVNNAKKNGVLIVGGGSPKNFYLQTQPMLQTQLGIGIKGHDYDIQITVDPPHWGGLSGATPDEAVSWGKINPNQLTQSSVVLYSDATVVLPIIFGYVLETCKPRPHKRLFPKIPKMIKELKKQMKLLPVLPEL